jgi:hypothetical protein
MTRTSPAETPAPLTVAVSLTAIEGVVLVMLGILEVATSSSSRLALAITTTVFFLGYGAALGFCAWSAYRGSSWARSPIILAQLIQLGVAFSFRDDPTTLLAVGLLVVALVVLAGMLHPASIEYLSEPADDWADDR